jgi:hypothetical protein
MNINGHEVNHLMDWCSSLKLLFRFTMQQVLDGSVAKLISTHHCSEGISSKRTASKQNKS